MFTVNRGYFLIFTDCESAEGYERFRKISGTRVSSDLDHYICVLCIVKRSIHYTSTRIPRNNNQTTIGKI